MKYDVDELIPKLLVYLNLTNNEENISSYKQKYNGEFVKFFYIIGTKINVFHRMLTPDMIQIIIFEEEDTKYTTWYQINICYMKGLQILLESHFITNGTANFSDEISFDPGIRQYGMIINNMFERNLLSLGLNENVLERKIGSKLSEFDKRITIFRHKSISDLFYIGYNDEGKPSLINHINGETFFIPKPETNVERMKKTNQKIQEDIKLGKIILDNNMCISDKDSLMYFKMKYT